MPDLVTCADPAVLRVASVPADHVYVRHLADPDGGGGIVRLDDPKPCPAPSDQAGWWPPVMLDPGWITRHHDEFDVFHVHFGFDAQPVSSLAELVGQLRKLRRPLVFTVHDLRNPHHADPRPHREQLDLLIPAAAELITLTAGAAALIEARWGRTPVVLPHPHVVPLDRISDPRAERGNFVVGVHVKSVRASMDPLPVIDSLADTVADLPGAVLRVDVHDEVLDPACTWYRPELVSTLRDQADRGRIDLRIHGFFSDDELWAYLRDEIDVSVLPYRFGTHSGWLEACHDLGTLVVAPDCGFYAQQRPCFRYGHDEAGLDRESLEAAVLEAHRTRPIWRAAAAARWAERRGLAAAHRELYAGVLR